MLITNSKRINPTTVCKPISRIVEWTMLSSVFSCGLLRFTHLLSIEMIFPLCCRKINMAASLCEYATMIEISRPGLEERQTECTLICAAMLLILTQSRGCYSTHVNLHDQKSICKLNKNKCYLSNILLVT